ncbi:MAG: FHA domain-containing protein [Gemmatimonadales bacterium]
MAYLSLNGERHPLPEGETVIGAGEACGIRAAGEGVAEAHAVVMWSAVQGASIRATSSSVSLRVNDVETGSQPHPLVHGDKISIGAVEILFSHTDVSRSTPYVSARTLGVYREAARRARAAGEDYPTRNGRLVSLTEAANTRFRRVRCSGWAGTRPARSS